MSPVDRYERVEVDDDGPVRRRREVAVDVGEERSDLARRLVNVVWLLVVLIDIFIGLRIILRLIAANPSNAFASFVYNLTDVFLLPFLTIAGTPAAEGMVLDVPAIIGGLVYLLFGWVLTKLLWLILRPARHRSVSEYEEID